MSFIFKKQIWRNVIYTLFPRPRPMCWSCCELCCGERVSVSGERQRSEERAVHCGSASGHQRYKQCTQGNWAANIRNTVSVCCDKSVTTQQNMLLKMKVTSSAMHLLYISIVVIVANWKWFEWWALNMKSRHWGHDKRGKQWSSGSGPWLRYLLMLSGCSVVISHVTLGSKSARWLETG